MLIISIRRVGSAQALISLKGDKLPKRLVLRAEEIIIHLVVVPSISSGSVSSPRAQRING